MIYSGSIRELPGPLKDHFYRRLFEILSGKDTSKDFASVTSDDRQTVLEILIDTDDDLPNYWRKMAPRRL